MTQSTSKKCTKCNRRISVEEFEWHLSRCYGSAEGVNLSSEEKAGEVENYEDYDEDWLPWERNIDATKNYGFPCREKGKYGSHPGHDGFDDESEP